MEIVLLNLAAASAFWFLYELFILAWRVANSIWNMASTSKKDYLRILPALASVLVFIPIYLKFGR